MGRSEAVQDGRDGITLFQGIAPVTFSSPFVADFKHRVTGAYRRERANYDDEITMTLRTANPFSSLKNVTRSMRPERLSALAIADWFRSATF